MRAVTSQLQAYQQQPMYQQPTPRGTRREQSANIGAPVGRRSPKRKKKRRKPKAEVGHSAKSVAPAPHAVAPSPLPSPEEKIPAAAKEAAKLVIPRSALQSKLEGAADPAEAKVLAAQEETQAGRGLQRSMTTAGRDMSEVAIAPSNGRSNRKSSAQPVSHMYHLEANAMLTIQDSSCQEIELKANKDGMVRVSTSCLMNIVVSSEQHKAERFLMLLNKARKAKGKIEYGPSGGSYVCSEEGIRELEAMGAKGFEGVGVKKMRFMLPVKQLDRFEDWFKTGRGTKAKSRDEAVRQVLVKEVVEEDPVFDNEEMLEAVKVQRAGFVRQRAVTSRPGKDHLLTERFFEVFDVVLPEDMKEVVRRKAEVLPGVKLASFVEIKAQEFFASDESQQTERIAATGAIAAMRSQSEVRVSAMIVSKVTRSDGAVLTVDYNPNGDTEESVPACYVDVGVTSAFPTMKNYEKEKYFTLPRCELENFKATFLKEQDDEWPYTTLQSVLTSKLNLGGGLSKNAVKYKLVKQGWVPAYDGDDTENECLLNVYEVIVDSTQIRAGSLGSLFLEDTAEVKGGGNKKPYQWRKSPADFKRLPKSFINCFVFGLVRRGGHQSWNLIRNAFKFGKQFQNSLTEWMKDASPAVPQLVSRYQTFRFSHSYAGNGAIDFSSMGDEARWWKNPLPNYDPKFYTAEFVLASSRLKKAGGWADPESIEEAKIVFNDTQEEHDGSAVNGKTCRLSTENGKVVGIEMEYITTSKDGTSKQSEFPRNPRERTGIRGRGVLGNWGPNYVADPVITRDHPVLDGLFQVLVVGRKKPPAEPAKKTAENPDANAVALIPSMPEDSHTEDSHTEDHWFSLPGGHTDTADEVIPRPLERLMNDQMKLRTRGSSVMVHDEAYGKHVPKHTRRMKSIKDAIQHMKDLNALAQEEEPDGRRSFQRLLYKGYITAPENTDSAWIQTHAQHIHLAKEVGAAMDIVKRVDSDSATGEQLAWMTIRPQSRVESPLCAHHHKLLLTAHSCLEARHTAQQKIESAKAESKKSASKRKLHNEQSSTEPKPVRALLIIDVQKDFVMDQGEGALGVPGGHTTVPVINYLRSKQFDHVFLCQDWHPTNHCSFCTNNPGRDPFSIINLPGVGPQQMWPDHCMQGSRGAEFHNQLITEPSDHLVRAGCNPLSDSYSAFNDNNKLDGSNLEHLLKMNGVTEIYCTGLATDYCVQYTILDARNIFKDADIFFVEDGCAGLNDTGMQDAYKSFKTHSITRIDSHDSEINNIPDRKLIVPDSFGKQKLGNQSLDFWKWSSWVDSVWVLQDGILKGEVHFELTINDFQIFKKEDRFGATRMIKYSASENTKETEACREQFAELVSQLYVLIGNHCRATMGDRSSQATPEQINAFKNRLENSTISNSEQKINAISHSKGKALLHLAAESGNLEIMEMLLDKGADVDICTNLPFKNSATNRIEPDERTPLHLAVEAACTYNSKKKDIKRYINCIAMLMDRNANAATEVGDTKMTPLMYACRHHNLELVGVLMKDTRVKVLSRDKFDKTALHYACSYPKPPRDDECKPAPNSSRACQIFERLFERAKREESTLESTWGFVRRRGELKSSRRVLAYLLQPDRKGWCSIHLAAKSGYLLDLLEQVKHTDNERKGLGTTKEEVAKFVQEFVDDVKWYASTEEDPHNRRSYATEEVETICGGMLTKTQLSPIHIAISNGRSDEVKVLVQNPITATLLSKQKNTMVLIKPRYTALDLAIKAKDRQSIIHMLKDGGFHAVRMSRFLVDNGKHLNHTTHLLHSLAQACETECVKSLLAYDSANRITSDVVLYELIQHVRLKECCIQESVGVTEEVKQHMHECTRCGDILCLVCSVKCVNECWKGGQHTLKLMEFTSNDKLTSMHQGKRCACARYSCNAQANGKHTDGEAQKVNKEFKVQVYNALLRSASRTENLVLISKLLGETTMNEYQVHHDIRKNAVEVNTKDSFDHSPLYLACKHGHTSVCKVLLDNMLTAKLSSDKNGMTPLSIAAFIANKSTMLYMLERCDVTEGFSANTDGLTPLQLMVTVNNVECISAMFNCREYQLARQRVPADEVMDIDFFVHKGCGDENTKPFSALTLAVALGHLDVIDLLVKQGADPMRLDGSGRSPFIRALKRNIEATQQSDRVRDNETFGFRKHRDASFESTSVWQSKGKVQPDEPELTELSVNKRNSLKATVTEHIMPQIRKEMRVAAAINTITTSVAQRKSSENIQVLQDIEKTWSQIEYMSEAKTVLGAIDRCGYVSGLGKLIPFVVVLCLFLFAIPASAFKNKFDRMRRGENPLFRQYQALHSQLKDPLMGVDTVQGWCGWMHKSVMRPSLLNSVQSNLVGSIRIEKQACTKCSGLDDQRIQMVKNWPHSTAIGKSCPTSWHGRDPAWDSKNMKYVTLKATGKHASRQQFIDVCSQWYRMDANTTIVAKASDQTDKVGSWLDPDTTSALRVSFTTYDALHDQFAVMQFESDIIGAGGDGIETKSFIYIISWNSATQCGLAPLCFSWDVPEANFGWVLILVFIIMAADPIHDLLWWEMRQQKRERQRSYVREAVGNASNRSLSKHSSRSRIKMSKKRPGKRGHKHTDIKLTDIKRGYTFSFLTLWYYVQKLFSWCIRHVTTLVLISIISALFYLNFVVNDELGKRNVDLSSTSDEYVDFIKLASRVKMRVDIIAWSTLLLCFNLLILCQNIPYFGPILKSLYKTAVDSNVLGFLACTLFLLVAFTLALYMTIESRLPPFSNLYEGIMAMMRVGFGEIEPMFGDDHSSIWRLSLTTELAFSTLFLFYIIAFSLIIMNLLISVLSSSYDRVIKTSKKDWKHHILVLMQELYQEKEKMQELWEHFEPEDREKRKKGWKKACDGCFARMYYFLSLLWLHDVIWMRGIEKLECTTCTSRTLVMSTESKKRQQKLLQDTLSPEEAAKHLSGEDGLYYPPSNKVLQNMVRTKHLHVGHSAWTSEDEGMENAANLNDREILEAIQKKLSQSQAESQSKMDAGELRVQALQRLVQSLAQNTCDKSIYKPTAADENRLKEAINETIRYGKGANSGLW
jgi:nicotinamidase/pyrazinamidase